MDSAAPRGADRRQEWRAVPQDPSAHSHSDERTIYEEGAGPRDVEYCSITIDGGDELMQQRLGDLVMKQQELRNMEVNLRAHAMARAEIVQVQNGYEARVKEHADGAAALKEQLQERERHLRELGAKLDEKDRELRAVKIDTEAAWAKEDLLREQNKEIATYRRERDNSEAERAQHLQKIHELQEHIQEKESQFLALEEQHRVAQETIHFKDEQLREAQTWIARAQEMDALHSTTNQSLQAELRDRTEQFNQYWIGLQRQFAEVERHHLQAIQQLQLELAEAREQNGVYKEGSHISRDNSVDGSAAYIQNKESAIDVNGGPPTNGNLNFMSNGNVDTASSFVAATSTSTKTEQVSGGSVVPSSIPGVGAYLPSGQITALHPFTMHPQGAPPVVSPISQLIPQSLVAHSQLAPMAPIQQRPNEKALPDTSQAGNQNASQPSQTENHLPRSNAQYSHQKAADRQVVHSGNLNTSVNNHLQSSGHSVNSPKESVQQVPQETHDVLTANLHLQASLGCDPPKQKSGLKVQDVNLVVASNQARDEILPSAQHQTTNIVSPSITQSLPVRCNNPVEHDDTAQKVGSSVAGKAVEPSLLDERSLLACIVRAIPAGSGGGIRISSTLPNRLGKMLAPLHWHDYKKCYGKLDEFLALHPELFVIEGDSIHLREGAQEIISKTTAYAKVAAAAASSAPHSSLLPSVAVTPVAQNNRQKKAPSTDSKQAGNLKLHQQVNGVSHNSVHGTVNGISSDRVALASSEHNGLSNGRHGFGGRQQGRSSGAGLISRRQN